MTAPLQPSEPYRAEFEVPEPKKKCCLIACCERWQQRRRDAKHIRSMTRHEIDYTMHVRAVRAFEEKKGTT